MQRLYESTAVRDFYILSLDRVIYSDPRLVDETLQEMTAVLNCLDWFDGIELVTDYAGSSYERVGSRQPLRS